MKRLLGVCVLALPLLYQSARAQVIEFESNGLKYQTLTKSGVTVMFAQMPSHLHTYATIQVAVSNGSEGPYVIRPEDFSYVRADGTVIRATPARAVVEMLFQKGSGNDVIKLVTAYEAGVYGNSHLKSTNGYEQRRKSALAMSSTKLRAAATASSRCPPASGTFSIRSASSFWKAAPTRNQTLPLARARSSGRCLDCVRTTRA